jgi:hypothetical protein
MPSQQISVENPVKTSEPETAPVAKAARMSVLFFAAIVSALVLLSAFFTDRNGWLDEIGLLNPPYMLAHFGKLSYPIYSFFDATIVHPPIHVGIIGLLARWGFTWFYAEAVPTVFFFLLTVVVIVRGRFPVPVQLGLLFSIGFLTTLPFVLFGTRPEGHLQAAWFAGLVLLEAGRLDGWNRALLFAGAFVLTWGCAVHYYGTGGIFGVTAYVAFAVVTLGWRAATPKVIALMGGACLLGAAYLAWYIVPYFHEIVTFIRLTGATDGVSASVRMHQQTYAAWSQATWLPVWIRLAVATRIPVMVFSTVILASIRATRGIAFAALPFQLFVYFLSAHKLQSYYLHEMSIYAAAVCCGVLVLADRLWVRIPFKFIRAAGAPVFMTLLAVSVCFHNPVLAGASVSLKPHVHEADVARAAVEKILGTHATVGGRLCLWYASGANHWYDISYDLLWYPQLKVEPNEYFRNFDALAEDQDQSDATINTRRGTLSSWYVDRTLKLRGFFFGETNVELQILLLSSQSPQQVVGYGLKNAQLYRFEQHDGGDYAVVSAVCDMATAVGLKGYAPFSSLLYLPGPASGTPPSGGLLTFLDSNRGSAIIPRLEKSSCRVIDRIPGSLFLDDRDALIDAFRKTDLPMHFDRELKNVPPTLAPASRSPDDRRVTPAGGSASSGHRR